MNGMRASGSDIK